MKDAKAAGKEKIKIVKERRRFVRYNVRKIVAYEVPDEMIRGKF